MLESMTDDPQIEAIQLRISGLKGLFARGGINRSQFERLTLEQQELANRLVLAWEQTQIREYEKDLGWESLTTDTVGKKDATWLKESGKSFATGIASKCLVCAIYHPEGGVAAVHKNPLTPVIVVRSIVRSVIFSLPHSTARADQMLSETEFEDFTRQTVAEAFDQFDLLSPPSLNGEILSLRIIGLDFASPSLRQILSAACGAELAESGGNRDYLGGVELQALEEIGRKGGYIYGHPETTSEPTFYNRFELYQNETTV